MHYTEVTVGRTLLATLDHGESLLGDLAALATEADVDSGRVIGFGAVQDAELASYDQDAFETETVAFPEPLGMPLLSGTITTGADGPEIRATAVLARPSGQPIAGLLERATVFEAEIAVRTFEESLGRSRDDATGTERLSL